MGVLTIMAAVGATVAVVGAAVSANQADKAAGRAERKKKTAETELANVKAARATITNPYEGVKDLSSMAKDLTNQMSNPFASLGVATQAAEIEIEQADIALANTLDTLRATGASAGGATALAMAALSGRKGVASSIEQQEAQNEKARAQGEQALNQQKISEQQRLQDISISEGQRVQQSDAAGKAYVYEAKEKRNVADLDHAASKIARQEGYEQDARNAKTAAIAGGFQAVGNIASSMSDRKLKENIKLIGYSQSGLKIYAFEFINKAFGEGTWQGVMSDEIPQHAVIKHEDGFDRVDYSKLDVTFKQI